MKRSWKLESTTSILITRTEHSLVAPVTSTTLEYIFAAV